MRTLADRFDEILVEGDNGCLNWPASRNLGGYGRLWVDNKEMRTHRYAYERANGPIPEGLFVLHRCDNPSCCNIDHLFLGTNADNMNDMYQKGRGHDSWLAGESRSNSKLTDRIVQECKILHYFTGVEQGALADHYGISNQVLNLAIRGKRWSHLAKIKL